MKILHWKDSEGRTGHSEPMEDEICEANMELLAGPEFFAKRHTDGTVEMIPTEPSIRYWMEPVDDSKGKQNGSHR